MFYELVIYLNYKNKTIFRLNRTFTRYKKGQQTSMGWIVLDKQYYDRNLKQFVGEETMIKNYFDRKSAFDKKYKRLKRKQKISEIIYQIFR